jgi:hypothetical protein
VAFGFYYDSRAGEYRVSVDGLVMNDLGEHTAAYQAATSALWAQFAANLADAAR